MYFINQPEVMLHDIGGFTTNSRFMPLTEVISEDGTVDWFELNYVNRESRERMITSVKDYDLGLVTSEFNQHISHSKDIPLPELNIAQGFKVGLIDYGNGALIQKDGTWFDGATQLTEHDLVGVTAHLSNKVSIIPCITERQVQEMDEKGVVELNGKIVAERSKEDGELVETWKLLSKGGRALSGEAIRVLHHLDIPVIISDGIVGGQLYHGLTSHDMSVDSLDGSPLSSSLQGEALYTTKSIHEAVTVYGNPKSFEVSGKKYSVSEDEKKRVGGEKSHLMIVQPDGTNNIYKADYSKVGRLKTLASMPSPNAVVAVCDLYRDGVNNGTVDMAAKFAVSGLLNARTSYDCYVAMNELNKTLSSTNRDVFTKTGGVLGKLLGSIGYDSLDISPPTPKQIEQIEGLIVDLDRPRSALKDIVDDLKMTEKGMKAFLNDHLKTIKSSIPAKMDKGHTIFFDQSKKPCVIQSLRLPTHTAVLTGEFPDPQKGYSDEFYSHQNKDETRFSRVNINLMRSVRDVQANQTETPTPEKPKASSRNRMSI